MVEYELERALCSLMETEWQAIELAKAAKKLADLAKDTGDVALVALAEVVDLHVGKVLEDG